MDKDSTLYLPTQKLPGKQKKKPWHEKCVKAVKNMSDQSFSRRRQDIKRLYDFYNGNIDELQDDYSYVLKPYGKTRKNFPSKLRNYNILKPTVDLLLGEKAKRPIPYRCASLDKDSVLGEHEAINQAVQKEIKARFVNALIDAGIATEENRQQVADSLQSVKEKAKGSYKDNKSIAGGKAMKVIEEETEYYDKIQDLFFHYLVAGECYTDKSGINGELYYEVLNPLHVDYDKDPNTKFIEDGDWAIVRKRVHLSTLIDRYYEQFSDYQDKTGIDLTKQLENPKGEGTEDTFVYMSDTDQNNVSTPDRNRLIEEYRVYWKSRKRIGFVTYFDEQTMAFEIKEVDENYQVQKNETIEWEWVNEVRYGVLVDDEHLIDFGIVDPERGTPDNPSKGKLPINGFRYSDTNSHNISLVSIGVPYQINYNIYRYRLETSVAKSKDVIGQFDINMIPAKWNMDKFMYYVDAFGMAWVDYNKEGVYANPQHQSVMDMTVKSISSYIELMENIVLEWERLSGVSRQRQGDIGQYETVTGSRQAIVQSSHITEDIFRKFERFEQRELQGLVDTAQVTWPESKTARFRLSDGSFDYFIADNQFPMTNYGIYITDSAEEMERFDTLKQLFQPMIQNGYPMSAVASMLYSANSTELIQKIKTVEEDLQKLQSEQAQAEGEKESQHDAREHAQEVELKTMDINKDLAIAEMKMAADSYENDADRQKAYTEIATKYDLDSKKLQVEMEKVKAMKQKQAAPAK